jgi:hypothetical protein
VERPSTQVLDNGQQSHATLQFKETLLQSNEEIFLNIRHYVELKYLKVGKLAS